MIVELNKLLAQNNLEFKIHISDTCGKQSFWIEPLNPAVEMASSNELYNLIEEYFQKYTISLAYNTSKTSFWVA
jgi:hypothetical protein